MNRAAHISAVLFAASVSFGCGGGGTRPKAVVSSGPSVETVWRSKCGACHVPVEPGTRTRETIQAAVGRHRPRLALSDEQWVSLVDFLAPRTASSR